MRECEVKPTIEEEHLLQMLGILEREYRKQAQPYVDRLVAIRTMRAEMQPMTITRDLALELGLIEQEKL